MIVKVKEEVKPWTKMFLKKQKGVPMTPIGTQKFSLDYLFFTSILPLELNLAF